jgi:hypothetical protein
MDKATVIGLGIVVGALVVNVGLVIWSRRRINTIARKGLRSVRDIAKELGDGG